MLAVAAHQESKTQVQTPPSVKAELKQALCPVGVLRPSPSTSTRGPGEAAAFQTPQSLKNCVSREARWCRVPAQIHITLAKRGADFLMGFTAAFLHA